MARNLKLIDDLDMVLDDLDMVLDHDNMVLGHNISDHDNMVLGHNISDHKAQLERQFQYLHHALGEPVVGYKLASPFQRSLAFLSLAVAVVVADSIQR